jgi:hypothetical protein
MNKVYTAEIRPAEPVKAFVGDDGIYVPCRYDFRYHEMLISKELFIEAYNKWIDNSASRYACMIPSGDNADDWCD